MGKEFFVLAKNLFSGHKEKLKSSQLLEFDGELNCVPFAPKTADDFKKKHEYGRIEDQWITRYFIIFMAATLDEYNEKKEKKGREDPKRMSNNPAARESVDKYHVKKERDSALNMGSKVVRSDRRGVSKMTESKILQKLKNYGSKHASGSSTSLAPDTVLHGGRKEALQKNEDKISQKGKTGESKSAAVPITSAVDEVVLSDIRAEASRRSESKILQTMHKAGEAKSAEEVAPTPPTSSSPPDMTKTLSQQALLEISKALQMRGTELPPKPEEHKDYAHLRQKVEKILLILSEVKTSIDDLTAKVNNLSKEQGTQDVAEHLASLHCILSDVDSDDEWERKEDKLYICSGRYVDKKKIVDIDPKWSIQKQINKISDLIWPNTVHLHMLQPGPDFLPITETEVSAITRIVNIVNRSKFSSNEQITDKEVRDKLKHTTFQAREKLCKAGSDSPPAKKKKSATAASISKVLASKRKKPGYGRIIHSTPTKKSKNVAVAVNEEGSDGEAKNSDVTIDRGPKIRDSIDRGPKNSDVSIDGGAKIGDFIKEGAKIGDASIDEEANIGDAPIEEVSKISDVSVVEEKTFIEDDEETQFSPPAVNDFF